MSWAFKRKIFASALWILALAPWCWVGSVFGREFLAGREVEALEVERVALEDQLAAADTNAPALSAEQQRLELSKWKLLPNSDIAGTMHAIESTAQSVGVDIRSIRTPSSSDAGRQLFDVAGHGTPEQICSWLSEVENHARLMVVESGSVAQVAPATVGFELRLATFHQGSRR